MFAYVYSESNDNWQFIYNFSNVLIAMLFDKDQQINLLLMTQNHFVLSFACVRWFKPPNLLNEMKSNQNWRNIEMNENESKSIKTGSQYQTESCDAIQNNAECCCCCCCRRCHRRCCCCYANLYVENIVGKRESIVPATITANGAQWIASVFFLHRLYATYTYTHPDQFGWFFFPFSMWE